MNINPYIQEKQTPQIDYGSAKVRIAAFHIDFNISQGVATDDSFLEKRITAIDKILLEMKNNKPDIIIFPEFFANSKIISRASRWATDYNSVVICGSYFDSLDNTLKGAIVSPNGNDTFYKKHLSPYDPMLIDHKVVSGPRSGYDFSIQIQGKAISVKVLICYDFYREYSSVRWEDTQLVIAPMFDTNWKEAIQKANELADEAVRTVLVNKSICTTPSVLKNLLPSHFKWLNKIARTWLIHLLRFFNRRIYDRIILSSSAHGPTNHDDLTSLNGLSDLNRKKDDKKKIWQMRSESAIIATYELGLDITTGKRNRHSSGYNYEAFQIYKIKDYL